MIIPVLVKLANASLLLVIKSLPTQLSGYGAYNLHPKSRYSHRLKVVDYLEYFIIWKITQSMEFYHIMRDFSINILFGQSWFFSPKTKKACKYQDFSQHLQARYGFAIHHTERFPICSVISSNSAAACSFSTRIRLSYISAFPRRFIPFIQITYKPWPFRQFQTFPFVFQIRETICKFEYQKCHL